MPKPTLDQIRSIGDNPTTYQWILDLITPPPAAPGPGGEALNLRCISTSLPKKSDSQTLEVNIRGHVKSQTGKNTYGGTIDLTFAETVDNTIMNWIREWREACEETNTGVHMPTNMVEADIKIIRLNRQDVPIWYYELKGCKLTDYSESELSGDNNVFQLSMTIRYEYFTDGAM